MVISEIADSAIIRSFARTVSGNRNGIGTE
jgi:hypothetical protein